MAGTEIVDGQAHPHVRQAAQHAHVVAGIVHEDGLGQLQLQVARLQARFLQDAGHRVHEAALLQLPRRDVHGHAHRRQPTRTPGHHLVAGFTQHPGAGRHDQPGLFQRRNELIRHHHGLAFGLPAQQRLHARHHARHRMHLGLVVQQEFLVGQRPSQRLPQLVTRLGLHIHVLVMNGIAARTLVLGKDLGQLRLADQLLGRDGTARPVAGPHAGRQIQLIGPHLEGVAQRIQHATGKGLRHRGRTGHGLHQQQKDIATRRAHQHRRQIGLARQRIDSDTNHLGHLLQQQVGTTLPYGTVDHLEMIKVQMKQRAFGAIAFRTHQRIPHALDEGIAIQHALRCQSRDACHLTPLPARAPIPLHGHQRDAGAQNQHQRTHTQHVPQQRLAAADDLDIGPQRRNATQRRRHGKHRPMGHATPLRQNDAVGITHHLPPLECHGRQLLQQGMDAACG